MHKENVFETVIKILRGADWDYSPLNSSCFDILGSDTDRSVLMKVYSNIDSATREQSEEMKRAAEYLSASPLIVGRQNSRGELDRQVVYERYGIPTIKPETLESYLRLRESSVVMNKKGGYYVSLDPQKIEERRKDEGYSVNALAKAVGVSRRTIDNYRDDGVATVEKAQRLEDVLGDVLQEIDIFDTEIRIKSQRSNEDGVARRLTRIGLEASAFRTAPFDVAARDDADRFVGKQDLSTDDATSIEHLLVIQRFSQTTPFLVAEDSVDDRIGTISSERLDDMSSKDELKAALR